ncbi:hypothetical protein LPW11_08660 [Geomonas sp. RF6]|uniref:hypothetical protein n=1 Tax=Geomonas sp. RF6 TaxID=2897342 RepID=UPI001E6121F8|nr:hypothetical protein [Geomonas sp. RF6]UFS72249.1 hypothetical protein LPW11_08660 [Geomonas sp. RF6]
MKKMSLSAALFLFILGVAGICHADLAGFMNSVNVQAHADMQNFGVKLSAQFGVPLPQVQTIIRQVDQPADAFMTLQLSQMSHRAPDTVLHTYQTKKGKGWGVIAKDLGIKPGSPEFHALKRGDLYFTGEPGGGQGGPGSGHGKGKGKGKGHGHNK